MNRTDAPVKQSTPFAVNGQRESILPTTPAGDNTASYSDGFPAITMILKSAGGLPPKGQDMNQILYELSALARWGSSGAINAWDAAFSTAIGGYPMGAQVLGTDGTTRYISTTDSNATNPNTGGAGWFNLTTGYLKTASNLSEIAAAGPAAVAAALANLGLGNNAGYVGRLLGAPRVFTSSGTYTPTKGTKKIIVEVQGAGAGGGGAGSTSSSTYSAGGCGTSGGYAMSLLDITEESIISVAVVVGTGGPGGNGNPTGGIGGGLSSFGRFITANGGNGSLTQPPTSAAFTITGTYGGDATGGNIINRRGDGSAPTICIGGLIVIGGGGSTLFGVGGHGYAKWNNNGKDGYGYGSGGSGATSNNSPSVFYSGGKGADGIVRIWEYA